jgi:hypothetical protein
LLAAVDVLAKNLQSKPFELTFDRVTSFEHKGAASSAPMLRTASSRMSRCATTRKGSRHSR